MTMHVYVLSIKSLDALCCKAHSAGDESIALLSKQVHLEVLQLRVQFPALWMNMRYTDRVLIRNNS